MDLEKKIPFMKYLLCGFISQHSGIVTPPWNLEHTVVLASSVQSSVFVCFVLFLERMKGPGDFATLSRCSARMVIQCGCLLSLAPAKQQRKLRQKLSLKKLAKLNSYFKSTTFHPPRLYFHQQCLSSFILLQFLFLITFVFVFH